LGYNCHGGTTDDQRLNFIFVVRFTEINVVYTKKKHIYEND